MEYNAIKGDTIPFTLDQIVDLDGIAVTTLSGWKCVFTLKALLADTTALITKSTELSGAAAITAVGTAFAWSLLPSETADLSPYLFYPFDVQVVDPSGRVSTPIVGSLILAPDVNTVNA